MGVTEDLIARGRAGEASGACLCEAADGALRLAVLLRPGVPMGHLMGLRPVCALGALDALREKSPAATLAWPGDVVLVDGDGHATSELCRLNVHAGTGEAGMFAVCEATCAGLLSEKDAEPLARAICARVDAWAADVRAGRGAAGPLAPILSEFFDDLALMGREASVVYPNGRVAAAGTLTAVDVWGRATVHLADGRELVISPEQASLR